MLLSGAGARLPGDGSRVEEIGQPVDVIPHVHSRTLASCLSVCRRRATWYGHSLPATATSMVVVKQNYLEGYISQCQ